MTYEEAIKHLKVVKERIRCGDEEFDRQRKEAIDMAIEALERQTPKKLVSTDWYQVRDGVQWKDWKCPTCGNVLWRKELTDEYCKPLTYTMQHHCICGQNIDNS